VLQHGAMQLQRSFRGMFLHSISRNECTLLEAGQKLNPLLNTHSFSALSVMYVVCICDYVTGLRLDSCYIRYKLAKKEVPPQGQVCVMALGDPEAEVPSKMLVKRPNKGDVEVATNDIRAFYTSCLQRCQTIMDDMHLPRLRISDVKDDMRGPGAGLLLSNENLFDTQVLQSDSHWLVIVYFLVHRICLTGGVSTLEDGRTCGLHS
jgi:hypothetical protein